MKLNGSFLLVLGLFLWAVSIQSVSAQSWQQQVDSDIRVTLDDQAHRLYGDIQITYHNNSPETLDFVWMHLWPNAYRNGKTAMAKQHYRDGDMFMFYAMSRDLGGIDSLAFTSAGQTLAWEPHPEHIDIAKVTLPAPLAPGESVEIATPFRVDLPSGSISRLGHVGESYQITQWYPKPAVYDEDGWHPMPYLSQGEFFSDYGTFDVRITLPSNYTVGATGDFVPGSENNDTEVKRLAQLVEETETWVTNEGWNDATNEFPASSEDMKTLHFRQSQVHDFAWFADKRYKVLQGEVTLPGDGRAVTTWAMFTPEEGELWQKAPEYLHDATYYYSLWNGDYPYNQVTAVDGTISAGGGMEYPNVTVIGSTGSASGLETVIVHEVGHNWFYGILGSNERENAWMDEGINSFNETRYLLTKYGEDKGLNFLVGNNNLAKRFDVDEFQYKWIDELSYLFPARFGADQPIQCHSNSLTQLNYGAIIYKKTAAA
ncbi:MAG: M1 family metallopeptidase, partial [Candidatus Poseidoniaceae archaeon]|nr:M1 family metallopeptidase [Candidatus Poseidoniaceae archaeon]